VDRQRGRSMQEQAKQELNRRGLWGYVEPILTMGSAAFAEPVSGLVGLAALPYGVDASARAIANTQEAMTYQPRTEDGQQGLQDLGEFMQPVGDAFIGASEYLGDAAYNATGSPALGAAAYSVPTMALEALGLKGARYASAGRAYEMGDIGTQASKYGGKQRGIFAGVKAKGADLKQMEAAQELANRGLSRDDIWNKTGWFEDVDGKWKFEIDDSRAEFLLNDDSPLTVGIDEAIKHDDLMAAYPDANKGIVRRRAGNGGSYSTTEGISGEQVDFIKLGMDESPVNQKSTLLHELQHAIQEREGFARGGSSEQFKTVKPAEIEALSSQAEHIENLINTRGELAASKLLQGIFDDTVDPKAASKELAKLKAEIEKKADKMFSGLTPHQQYMRLAGEAEARNVQTRLDYTPEQRRATPPWDTLDVPEDELIVRRGNGVAQSITPQDAAKELEARGIDMSTEARLQRAKDMGFDTDQVYYHGTDRDFSEFKSIGERDYGHYGQGYYFAPDPFTSNYYAESAAKVRGGAPTSYPVRLKYKKPYYLDEFTDEPQALQAGQDPKFTENLKKKGYDAVIRRSIDRDSSTGEILDEYLKEIVVFEPSQIRSINASFNPEHIDSGDLIK